MNDTILYTNSLWDEIVANAEKNPEKIVLQEIGGNVCLYTTFIEDVNSIALLLNGHGIKQGDRVLFLERPSLRAIKIFFAIYRLGAVAVVADPAMGRENFASRVKFANCKHVVLDPLLNKIRHIPGVVSILRKFYPTIPDLNIELPKTIVLPKEVGSMTRTFSENKQSDKTDALIIFTSGTTSVPKGVVHTFGSLLETLKLIQNKINTGENDVFFSSQLHFSIIALISGATAIIDTSTTFDPKRFLGNVITLKPTHTFLLPVEGQKIIECLNNAKQKLPDSLRCIMFGSAPVLTGFVEKFTKFISKNSQVLCIYGSTEILPISIATAEEKLSYGDRGDYLGHLLPSVRVEVKDEEFLVSGPNLCSRYLHEDIQLPHFLSGDLGFVTKDMELVMTGRKKDMIIKDHHNVYPALFEPTISKISGVKNCALVGIYDEDVQDERIHLCVEKEDGSMSDAVFKKHVQRELKSGAFSIDSYALPDEIHIMKLPLSGRSQKINKQKIKELLAV